MAVITARRALCARPVAAQLIPQHGRLIALNVDAPPRDIEGELRHREANGLAQGHTDKSGQARSGTQSPWPLHRSLTCLLPTPPLYLPACLLTRQVRQTLWWSPCPILPQSCSLLLTPHRPPRFCLYPDSLGPCCSEYPSVWTAGNGIWGS